MPNVIGDSPDANTPAVLGTSSTGAAGVRGECPNGDGVSGTGRRGVVGVSDTYQGVYGYSRDNAGVVGESKNFHGVFAVSHGSNNGGVIGSNDAGGFGVIGISNTNVGVSGESGTGIGVRGQSEKFQGVFGHSRDNAGVVGVSDTMTGVWGECTATDKGTGVFGKGLRGVVGESEKFQGVFGHSVENCGVVGVSEKFAGIWAETKADGPPALFVKGPLAGRFEGNVEVTGDIRLVNSDCAEDFDVIATEEIDPGTVMVLDAAGSLRAGNNPYDRRVAGVVSGAGEFKPAIVLGRHSDRDERVPIALIGKVYCKADAGYGPIEVGDLLTTSATIGHAMKALDPFKAFGSVIGKALRRLPSGRGLIPILVTLQ